jgi:hypothetical protein
MAETKMTGMYDARAEVEQWLAQHGHQPGDYVDWDAHCDDGQQVVIYASIPNLTTTAVFTLPPGWTYHRLEIEEFFNRGPFVSLQDL